MSLHHDYDEVMAGVCHLEQRNMRWFMSLVFFGLFIFCFSGLISAFWVLTIMLVAIAILDETYRFM
jgi:hypothetical protein